MDKRCGKKRSRNPDATTCPPLPATYVHTGSNSAALRSVELHDGGLLDGAVMRDRDDQVKEFADLRDVLYILDVCVDLVREGRFGLRDLYSDAAEDLIVQTTRPQSPAQGRQWCVQMTLAQRGVHGGGAIARGVHEK